MPTYEYRCPDGHEFEKFTQKMSDAQSELVCPTCGKVAPRRMSAGGGLLFKGSGFYITDYGKDGKKDQRAATTKPESSTSDAKKSEGSAATSAPAPAATSSAKETAPAPSTTKPATKTSGDKPKSGPAK